jgi:hypothetical protein
MGKATVPEQISVLNAESKSDNIEIGNHRAAGTE